MLDFGLAHARARDAVQATLDVTSLEATLAGRGFSTLSVSSRAVDRQSYLLRPDLGRALAPSGIKRLEALPSPVQLVWVIGDGLSASAAERHGVPLLMELQGLLPPDLGWSPVVLATLARVGLGDEIGECLGASLVVMLIGERPGLSAPDSLGAYLTWQPRKGRSDAERNCVSNIHLAGLGYAAAAQTLSWLISEALRRQVTGVNLKDESDSVARLSRVPMPE